MVEKGASLGSANGKGDTFMDKYSEKFAPKREHRNDEVVAEDYRIKRGFF